MTNSVKPVGVTVVSRPWIPTDKLSSLLMHTATTERDSSSPPTKNFERFSNFNESRANHSASQMPNDSAQFALYRRRSRSNCSDNYFFERSDTA